MLPKELTLQISKIVVYKTNMYVALDVLVLYFKCCNWLMNTLTTNFLSCTGFEFDVDEKT